MRLIKSHHCRCFNKPTLQLRASNKRHVNSGLLVLIRVGEMVKFPKHSVTLHYSHFLLETSICISIVPFLCIGCLG